MDAPPRISNSEAKVVDVEVVEPETKENTSRREDGPPIHALSALVMIAVDSLWAIFIWEPPLWVITIPFCFGVTFIPVYLIQRHLKKDGKGRAAAFAAVLAVLAALPMPIATEPIGIALLAWTGLGKLLPGGMKRK